METNGHRTTSSVYTFRGKPYSSFDELAVALLDAPEAADTHIKRGYIERWLSTQVGDYDAAASIAELASRRWKATGALALASVAAVAPRVELRYGEVVLDEAILSHLALAALGNDELAEEAAARLSSIRPVVAEALPFLVTLDPDQRAVLARWTDVHDRMAKIWASWLVLRLRRYAEEPADSSRTLPLNPSQDEEGAYDALLVAYSMLVSVRHATMASMVPEVDGWFDDGSFAYTGVRKEFWALDSDPLVIAAIGALCERVAAPFRAAHLSRMRGRAIAANGTLKELDAWLAESPRSDFLDHWNIVECVQLALARDDAAEVADRIFFEATKVPHSNNVMQRKLMFAVAQYGTLAQFQRLATLGFEVDNGFDNNLQPLHAAAARSRHLDLVRAMASSPGARVDARSEQGLTPLALAVMEQPDPSVAEALVALGADLNPRAPEGSMGTWTLRNGRQVEVKGMTILDLAHAYNANPAVAARLMALGATATPVRTAPPMPAPSHRAVNSGSRRANDSDRDVWIGIAIGSTPFLIAVFHPGWAFVGAAYIAFNATMQRAFYFRGKVLAKRAWSSMAVTSSIWVVITLAWALARFST